MAIPMRFHIGEEVGFWRALNPAIYLISILPGLSAFLMAGLPTTSSLILFGATLGVVFLQHGINVLNDVTDWKKGADVEKYDSWIVFHEGQLGRAKLHGMISLGVGLTLGLFVLVVAQKIWILAIAAPLILLGILYNSGERPLSYTHYGEWVTGLCYGPGVFGCLCLLQSLEIRLAVLGSIAYAALSMALLVSHQTVQVLTDTMAGKRSVAVRIGADRTHALARALFYLFLLTLTAAVCTAPLSRPAQVAQVAGAAYLSFQIKGKALSPKTILLPSSLLVTAVLLIQLTLSWGTP